MINFAKLIVGASYDRPTLARMWGYASYNAISRGVVTPRDQNLIILFITKEKQQCLTQYEDHIEQDILFWEGENNHGSDRRIIARKDELHVFYRERHHSAFIYEGRATLNTYCLYAERPSKFSFSLIDRKVSALDIVAEIQRSYTLNETEKEALIKARRGQGLYRREAIRLWQDCSLTGFGNKSILIASHIKPWKLSNNSERIDAYNSLLLVPTVDKLFDKGYVGFEPTGRILLSDKISAIDWDKINISDELHLRFVPEQTKPFLEYHCEYVFDLAAPV